MGRRRQAHEEGDTAEESPVRKHRRERRPEDGHQRARSVSPTRGTARGLQASNSLISDRGLY